MVEKKYNGISGSGKSIHVVNVFVRPSDSAEIHYLQCGTTHGGFSAQRIRITNKEITCKKCLKKLNSSSNLSKEVL